MSLLQSFCNYHTFAFGLQFLLYVAMKPGGGGMALVRE